MCPNDVYLNAFQAFMEPTLSQRQAGQVQGINFETQEQTIKINVRLLFWKQGTVPQTGQ